MNKDRVTIMVDPKLKRRIKKIQAYLILHDSKNHSFSEVMNTCALIGVQKWEGRKK